MKRILVKYASRERPELFKRTIRLWKETAEIPDRIHFLCSFDTDDKSMNNDEVKAFCNAEGVECYYGTSANKIEAINRDIEKTRFDYDYLVVGSDDTEPAQGWDSFVVDNCYLDSAVWTYDGRQRRICTCLVIGVEAFLELLNEYIYDPRYQSVYADNWQTDLLQRAGVLKYIDEPVFVHKWCVHNNDELMKRNESRKYWEADERTYKAMGGNEITCYMD